MKTLLSAAALVAAVSIAHPSYSGHGNHKHEGHTLNYDENIQVQPGYAVIQVQGLVCEVCSKKAKKALEKLPFIDHVLVNLDRQLITVKITPGEILDLKLVGEKIESKGFNPYMAYTLDEDGSTIMHGM